MIEERDEVTSEVTESEATPKFTTFIEDAPLPPPEETPKVVVLSRKKKDIKLKTVPEVSTAPDAPLALNPDVPNSTANSILAEMEAGRAVLAKHAAERARNGS